MKIDYDKKTFVPRANSSNGETSAATLFHYTQKGNIVTAQYQGGDIVFGQLIGLVSETGSIDMRYQQVNAKGELMTGTCISTPEILENGKIRLHELWQWTSGDFSKGQSIIDEI